MPRGPIRPPWRDEPLVDGKSPRDILKELSKGLCISKAEIELILTRTDKLRILYPELTRGRNMVGLILASAISWVRWSASRRRPMPYPKFISLCFDHGYRISKRLLLSYVRLYRSADLYSTGPNALEILSRYWDSVKEKFDLDEEVRTEVVNILNDKRLIQGRKPEVAVTTAIYVVCKNREPYGGYVTQKALADMFGTNDVTMRLVIKAWAKVPDFRKRYLKADTNKID